MKRSRKVVPIKARATGGMTGRASASAIEFSTKAALLSREAVNPDALGDYIRQAMALDQE